MLTLAGVLFMTLWLLLSNAKAGPICEPYDSCLDVLEDRNDRDGMILNALQEIVNQNGLQVLQTMTRRGLITDVVTGLTQDVFCVFIPSICTHTNVKTKHRYTKITPVAAPSGEARPEFLFDD